MKKLVIIFLCILSFSACSFAEVTSNDKEPVFVTQEYDIKDVETFCENGLWGLKDKTSGEVLVEAKYLKMIMVGHSSWIVQQKNKFGLIDSTGNILLPIKYRHVDRMLGRFVKIGNDSDFGIYDQYGKEVLPPIYNSIDLLYGKMFLTYRNFRYGVSDFKGNILIANICDDIYMPSTNIMKIKYLGTWYEIEDVTAEKLAMPEMITKIKKDDEFKVTDIVIDTGAISGYSILTFSDYMIKVISSISPAHEETIDELILSHGVDSVNILKRFSWMPKYPVTFAKKYYVHVRNPFNGPLADLRYGIKSKI